MDRIAGQVASREKRVEVLLDRQMGQRFERAQLVLSVRVDGVDEVALVELTAGEAIAQAGEGEVIRGRHALVAIERQELRAIAVGDPPLHDRPRVVGGSVVDDHELVDEAVEALEHRFDRRCFVVGGDDGDPSGCSCLGSWFRGRWRGMMTELVLGARARQRDIFNPDVVRRLVDEHVSGRFEHMERLWALVNFELWLRRFVDGEEDVRMPQAASAAHARVAG